MKLRPPTRPLPAIHLAPLSARHVNELSRAARAVAADDTSRLFLGWARDDYAAEDAQRYIDRAVTSRRNRSGETLCMRDTEGTFLGCLAIRNIDWLHGCCQARLWLVPAARGQGYGEAGLRAMAQWARSHGLVRLELMFDADNLSAQAVVEKVGARHEGRLAGRFLRQGHRVDAVLYALCSLTHFQES